jgi:hypothetical protein
MPSLKKTKATTTVTTTTPEPFASLKDALRCIQAVAEDAQSGEMDGYTANNSDTIRVLKAFRLIRCRLHILEAAFHTEIAQEIEARQSQIEELRKAAA